MIGVLYISGGETFKNTYYLNLDNKQWIRGPDMTRTRYTFTCSLITKPTPQIVIVGGAITDSVEIINLETNTATAGIKLSISSKLEKYSLPSTSIKLVGTRMVDNQSTPAHRSHILHSRVD